MQKQFNINDKTVDGFLKDHAVDIDMDSNRLVSGGCRGDVFHYLKGEIYLRKTSGIEPQTTVTISVSDVSRGSQKDLLNVYTFFATEYDSFTLKLSLKEFELKVI